jgi:hypothetical protein
MRNGVIRAKRGICCHHCETADPSLRSGWTRGVYTTFVQSTRISADQLCAITRVDLKRFPAGRTIMPKRAGRFLLKRSGCFVVACLAGCKRADRAAARAATSRGSRARRATGRPIYREWVAILDGYVNAQIQARVSGLRDRAAVFARAHSARDDSVVRHRPAAVPRRARQANAELGEAHRG